MSFPSPLVTPLPVSGAAALTWAPIGTTLSVDPSGHVTGDTTFTVVAGAPYGIGVSGIPFVLGSLPTATLTLAGGGPYPLACVPAPDGSTPTGYGLVFIIPPDVTMLLAPGYYAYLITVSNAQAVTGPVILGQLYVEASPVPLPPVLRRGTPATFTLGITWTGGTAPDFTDLSLVWVASQDTQEVLRKQEAAGQLSSTNNGVDQLTVVIPLSGDDTKNLAAGALDWTLADVVAGVFGSGSITLL